MKVKPLFDRVIICPETETNVTKTGIVLPETSQERPQTGKVVAVGDGENLDGQITNMRVKVGDCVIFNKYIGTEIKIDEVDYVVLRQIDIIGVIDD